MKKRVVDIPAQDLDRLAGRAWQDAATRSLGRGVAVVGRQGEQLTKILDFRGMFQWPAVSFIQLTLTHTIHHRGQLSMYLRPMGATVPAIYGESYDTTQARLAKEGKAS